MGILNRQPGEDEPQAPERRITRFMRAMSRGKNGMPDQEPEGPVGLRQEERVAVAEVEAPAPRGRLKSLAGRAKLSFRRRLQKKGPDVEQAGEAGDVTPSEPQGAPSQLVGANRLSDVMHQIQHLWADVNEGLQRRFSRGTARPSVTRTPPPEASPKPDEPELLKGILRLFGVTFPNDLDDVDRWGILRGAGKTGREAARRVLFGLMSLNRGTVVALSIDGSIMRKVTIKGDKVVAWESVTFEQDASSIGLHVNERGVDGAPVTVPLGKRLKTRQGRVITDFPHNAALVRRVQIPHQGRYLNNIVQAEVVETIPFMDHDVDILFHPGLTTLGREALATVVPKHAIDIHVATLRSSGIRPASVFSRAEALAYVSGVESGIVAHREGDRLLTVLVLLRAPMMAHEIDLPAEGEAVASQARAIAGAVEQMASYAEGMEDAGTDLQVVLTGDFFSDAELKGAVQELLERDVVRLAPALDYPPEFPAQEYAVNLGLAMADRSRSSLARPAGQLGWPSRNLTSERHSPALIKPIHVAVFGGLALMAMGAYFMTPAVNEAAAKPDELRARLEELNRQERQYRLLGGRVQKLTASAAGTGSLAAALAGRPETFAEGAGFLREQVETIFDTAEANGASLAALGRQAGAIHIEGTIRSFPQLLSFVRALRGREDLFTAVKVPAIRQVQDESLEGFLTFDATVTYPYTDPQSDSPAGRGRRS